MIALDVVIFRYGDGVVRLTGWGWLALCILAAFASATVSVHR